MSKNIVCKRAYVNKILFHEPEIRCNSNDCWGAHQISELQIDDEIKDFRETKLTSELLFTLYLSMKNIIIFNWEILNKLSIITVNKKDFMKLELIEMLHLWINYSSQCRKYQKKFFDYPFLKSKGIYRNDIPTLYLENLEPIAWGLNKSLNVCSKHLNFLENLKKGYNKFILLKDFCYYSHNCKEGTHIKEFQICADDLINGKCLCLSKTDNDNKLKNINIEILNLTKNLTKILKYRCPIIDNAKGQIKEILLKLREKIYEKEISQRKIHLSDNRDHIPFKINFNTYLQQLKKEENDKLKKEELIINKINSVPKIKKIPKVRIGFCNK